MEKNPHDDLPWYTRRWNRCRAYKELKYMSSDFFGRCDLVRHHEGDHALERGMDVPRWSTEWTA